jgi:hypothetical protein
MLLFNKMPFVLALTLPALFAAQSVSAAPKNTVFETKGNGYTFSYSYPKVVEQFPVLKAQLDKERKGILAEVKAEGSAWIKDRPADYGGMTLHRDTSWQQVTNVPGYLSLTVDEYRFDGGAHGNYERGSIIWDKAAGKQIVPIDMFSSKAAFDTLVQTPFCDKLDIERSHKRDGEKIDRSQTEDWMQACPIPSDYTIILGSSDGKKFNRFSVYIGPYGAGPYSEGDYEIDLAVTSALLAAVKPAYLSAFAVTPKARK